MPALTLHLERGLLLHHLVRHLHSLVWNLGATLLYWSQEEAVVGVVGLATQEAMRAAMVAVQVAGHAALAPELVAGHSALALLLVAGHSALALW